VIIGFGEGVELRDELIPILNAQWLIGGVHSGGFFLYLIKKHLQPPLLLFGISG
jgi:hypothetical protein